MTAFDYLDTSISCNVEVLDNISTGFLRYRGDPSSSADWQYQPQPLINPTFNTFKLRQVVSNIGYGEYCFFSGWDGFFA